MTASNLVQIAQQRDEPTQASFMPRLAAAFGCVSQAQFCTDARLDIASLRTGDAAELTRLARLVGSDPTIAVSNALRRVGSHSYELRGCHVHSRMLRTASFALCPACVQDDVDTGWVEDPFGCVHLRTAWLLRAVGTCGKHRLRLVEVSTADVRFARREFTHHGWEAAVEIMASADQAVERDPTGLEQYVSARLDRKAAVEWLDDMPLSAVVGLSERIGAILLTGKCAIRSLDREAIRQTGQAGFKIMERGPAGIQAFLHERLRLAKDKASVVGLESVVGDMTAILQPRGYRTSDFAAFKHQVTEFVSANLAFDLMPTTLRDAPRPISVADAARESGECADDLLDALVRLGMLTRKQAEENGVAAKASVAGMKRALAEARRTISAGEAMTMLGVSEADMDDICTSRILVPSLGTGRKVHRRFRADAVERLLDRCKTGTCARADIAGELVDIKQAASETRCASAEIIGLLAAGRLATVVETHSGTGLLRLRISAAEVRSCLQGDPSPTPSMMATKRRLNTSFVVVQALLEKGYLKMGIRTRGWGCKGRAVLATSVDGFEAEMISLHQLAKSRRQALHQVSKDLQKQGIAPAIAQHQVGTTFFRRTDVL